MKARMFLVPEEGSYRLMEQKRVINERIDYVSN